MGVVSDTLNSVHPSIAMQADYDPASVGFAVVIRLLRAQICKTCKTDWQVHGQLVWHCLEVVSQLPDMNSC